MIKRILVPIDGSEHSFRAVEFAGNIAAGLGASISIVQVLDKLPARMVLKDYLARLESEGEPNDAEIQSVRAALERSGEKDAEEQLARAKDVVARLGVSRATTEILDGDPAEEILGLGASFDLIVMGRRGRGGLKGLLMGSVSQKVSNMATCPVVTVG